MKNKVILFIITLMVSVWARAQQWDGASNLTDVLFRTGTVGIGTSDVQEKLYIQGVPNTVDVEWILGVKNPSNVNTGTPYGVGIKLRQGRTDEHHKWSGIASISESTWANVTGLALYANETEQVRIQGNGNVGIGTTTPSEKLSVNGTIRSKEVKVEAAPWPDYVFSEDYDLPTLEETEAYIKENKHLPGIPTAEEVAEEGIALGEMNAKLLEKVEEMMLYNIQQEKRINNQEEVIRNLLERIEKLESRRSIESCNAHVSKTQKPDTIKIKNQKKRIND